MKNDLNPRGTLMRLSALLPSALLAWASAHAQTPAGLWMTIDDATKAAKAHVRITDESGVLRGTIVKIVDPKEKPDSVCDQCTDDRKDKPIVGLTIIRNLKKNGERWDGGDILDPNNGKVYRAQLTLSQDNQSLFVRGYIGTPLLGRSQTWKRVAE
jgi:uncharacterized protein (DUF2147 family)